MSFFSQIDIDAIFLQYCTLKDKSTLSKVNRYYRKLFSQYILPIYEFFGKTRTEYKYLCGMNELQNDKPEHLFAQAIYHQNLYVAEYVYNKYKPNLNIANNYLFNLACSNHNLDIVTFIHNKSNDVVTYKAFYQAVMFNQLRVLKYLYTTDFVPENDIILDYACSKTDMKNIKTIEYLITISPPTQKHIAKACESGCLEKVQLLLKPNYDMTYLIAAINSRKTSIINYVLKMFQYNNDVTFNIEIIKTISLPINYSIAIWMLAYDILKIKKYVYDIFLQACDYSNTELIKYLDSHYDIDKKSIPQTFIQNSCSLILLKYAQDQTKLANRIFKKYYNNSSITDYLFNSDVHIDIYSYKMFKKLCRNGEYDIVRKLMNNYVYNIAYLRIGVLKSTTKKHTALSKYLYSSLELRNSELCSELYSYEQITLPSDEYITIDPEIRVWLATKKLKEN